MNEITVTELEQKLKSDEKFVLLDVREAWELDQAKIADNRLEVTPMSRLAKEGPSALPESVQKKENPVYVMCHHGNRSRQVTMWLESQGYENIFNVSGGIAEFANKINPEIGVY
ncbi:MAG: rhodanese-like domain-containing protein [Anaerolineales bacterium]